MSEHESQSPFNAVPPVVVALAVFILGIECVFYLAEQGIIGGPASIGWRLAAYQQYAFSSDILFWMIETGRWPVEQLLRFVSYLFLHGNFIHAGFAAVMVLALGKMVGEVFSPTMPGTTKTTRVASGENTSPTILPKASTITAAKPA